MRSRRRRTLIRIVVSVAAVATIMVLLLYRADPADPEVTVQVGGCLPASPRVDEPVTCTATVKGADTVAVKWSAPGGLPPSGSGLRFTTAFSRAGSEPVTVSASGAGGSDFASTAIGPPKVAVNCTPQSVSVGEQSSCTASLGGGAATSITWVTPEHSQSGSETFTRFNPSFSSPGTKQASAKACDAASCASDSTTVSVHTEAGSVTLASPSIGANALETATVWDPHMSALSFVKATIDPSSTGTAAFAAGRGQSLVCFNGAPCDLDGRLKYIAIGITGMGGGGRVILNVSVDGDADSASGLANGLDGVGDAGDHVAVSYTQIASPVILQITCSKKLDNEGFWTGACTPSFRETVTSYFWTTDTPPNTRIGELFENVTRQQVSYRYYRVCGGGYLVAFTVTAKGPRRIGPQDYAGRHRDRLLRHGTNERSFRERMRRAAMLVGLSGDAGDKGARQDGSL